MPTLRSGLLSNSGNGLINHGAQRIVVIEQVIATVLAFALGAVVASFLNVVADRVPRGQSIVGPGSHCPECGHELSARELIPVLSYLMLRGRCQICRSRIPARVPLAELAGGLLFGFAIWRYGATLDGVLAAAFFAFLLLVTIIDLEHKLVLNKVLLAGLPLAVLSAAVWSMDVRFPVFLMDNQPLAALLDAALAGVAGLSLFVVFAVLSRGGMGLGDVKLAGVLGIWLGLRVLPVALLVAVILGGLIAAMLLLTRAFGRKDAIPFAPFLCAGAGIGFVWGEAIGNWYLGIVTGQPGPGA